jgi:hypothetical protein
MLTFYELLTFGTTTTTTTTTTEDDSEATELVHPQ